MRQIKLTLFTSNPRLKNWLESTLKDYSNFKLVSDDSDFTLHVQNVEYIYKEKLLDFLGLAKKGAAIFAKIDALTESGVQEIFQPVPQPEFYRSRIPESFIALVDSQLTVSPQSLLLNPKFDFANFSLGYVKDFIWRDLREELIAPSSSQLKIQIVIPTKLKKSSGIILLNRLIDSLKLATLKNVSKVVVVVDDLHKNSSLVKQHPKITYLDFSGVFNYSKKINLGASEGDSDIILILNDDMAALSENWEDELLRSFSDKSVGIVGALLLYPSGRIQHAGVSSTGSEVFHLFRYSKLSDPAFNSLPKVYEVQAVTGAFMAIRRSAWDKFGGMNVNFPINFGDFELCLRARQMGFRTIQNNKIVFEHLESATRMPGINSFEKHQLNSLLRDEDADGTVFVRQEHGYRSIYDVASFAASIKENGIFYVLMQALRFLARQIWSRRTL